MQNHSDLMQKAFDAQFLFVCICSLSRVFISCHQNQFRRRSRKIRRKKKMVFVMKCIFFFNEIVVKFKIQMMMPIKNESFMRY